MLIGCDQKEERLLPGGTLIRHARKYLAGIQVFRHREEKARWIPATTRWKDELAVGRNRLLHPGPLVPTTPRGFVGIGVLLAIL